MATESPGADMSETLSWLNDAQVHLAETRATASTLDAPADLVAHEQQAVEEARLAVRRRWHNVRTIQRIYRGMLGRRTCAKARVQAKAASIIERASKTYLDHLRGSYTKTKLLAKLLRHTERAAGQAKQLVNLNLILREKHRLQQVFSAWKAEIRIALATEATKLQVMDIIQLRGERIDNLEGREQQRRQELQEAGRQEERLLFQLDRLREVRAQNEEQLRLAREEASAARDQESLTRALHDRACESRDKAWMQLSHQLSQSRMREADVKKQLDEALLAGAPSAESARCKAREVRRLRCFVVLLSVCSFVAMLHVAPRRQVMPGWIEPVMEAMLIGMITGLMFVAFAQYSGDLVGIAWRTATFLLQCGEYYYWAEIIGAMIGALYTLARHLVGLWRG